MADIAVEAHGLSRRYRLGSGHAGPNLWRDLRRMLSPRISAAPDYIWALKDVSFRIQRGERVGIIGANGAGKSTLLKVLSKVVYPTDGEVRIRGRLTSLLEVGTGFNDQLSGRDNVFLNAALYGLSRDEIASRFADIVTFADVARFIDTPIKNYSSGMKMRLAFAVAAHLDPDILLMDEVLAVGDLAFQRKCLERVEELTSGDRTLLFVSHSMDAIVRFCDRCIWLDKGRIAKDGPAAEVSSAYVEAMLGARPSVSAEDLPTPTVRSKPSPQAHEKAGEAFPTFDTMPDASFVSAQVINADGGSTSYITSDQKVGVRMRYRVHAPGLYTPAIALFCPKGALAFWAVPPQTEIALYTLQPGDYEATAWVSADLLNCGGYTVTLSVVSPNFAPVIRHFTLEQALAFHVVDAPHGAELARGIAPRAFPGPVRPKLQWDRRTLETARKATEQETMS